MPHHPRCRKPSSTATIALLALLYSLPVHAEEDLLSPDAPTATAAPAAEDATVPSDATPEAATRAQHQPAPATAKQRWNPRKDHNTPKFLGLVGLLLLWLLARSESRRQATSTMRRPHRPTPISPTELGHAAFQAAMDADLDQYRGLFLSGPEAAQVLGTDGAESYLNRRSLATLADALAELAARIPDGAHYEDAALEGDDLCLITLRLPDRSKATLPLGSVVNVGRVLRLRDPSSAS